MSCAKDLLEFAELILKVIALAGAVTYIIFRLTNGFHIFNLSISLKCERQTVPDGADDYLLIVVGLKKGDVSVMELHDIQARVSCVPPAQEPLAVQFICLKRLEHRPLSDTFQIVWQDEGALRLRPGEETQFSAMVRVPPNLPCFVELAVIGKRAFVGFVPGKWKASAHVLPQNRG